MSGCTLWPYSQGLTAAYFPILNLAVPWALSKPSVLAKIPSSSGYWAGRTAQARLPVPGCSLLLSPAHVLTLLFCPKALAGRDVTLCPMALGHLLFPKLFSLYVETHRLLAFQGDSSQFWHDFL